MKILLAVDGSEYTKRMLAYLAAHPELLVGPADFTALTVNWPVTPGARAHLPAQFVNDYYNQNATEVLEPVVAFAKQKNWTLTTLSKIGNPGEVLAETANEGKYDLVIMGSHGRSAVMSMVLGSVVTHVLARSKAPLLIIR